MQYLRKHGRQTIAASTGCSVIDAFSLNDVYGYYNDDLGALAFSVWRPPHPAAYIDHSNIEGAKWLTEIP